MAFINIFFQLKQGSSSELPTEDEVLDELTNGKVSEMGQSVLKNYQSLEVAYFNEAQQQQKRRNIDQADRKVYRCHL